VIRAIGVRQAKRYFQSAERIDATRAFALGLAHEVVEEEALDAKIDEVVQALLSGGPKAQAAAKELITRWPTVRSRPRCSKTRRNASPVCVPPTRRAKG